MDIPIAPTSQLWRYALCCVIGLYVILALAQSFWVPVFEGSDEQRHYAYARYLVNERKLPPRPTTAQEEYHTYQVAQEAGQPPLYYLLVGLITASVQHADEVDAFVQYNWFRTASDDQGIPYDNHSYYLYTTAGDFPWQGAALAVHLGRLLSVLIGALTLCGVYGIARTVVPERPVIALLATSFCALIPNFTFVNATITNDVPVVLFSTLSMWVAARIVREGSKPRLVVLGGLFAALTVLSKFNGVWVIGVLVIAVIAGAWLRRKDTPRPNVWLALGLLIGVWLLLSGWWFVYGYVQDGDPLGVALHTSKAGQGILSVIRVDWSMLNMISLQMWERSTWYSVAWSQIDGPEWFTMIFRIIYSGGLSGVALSGIVFIWRSRQGRRIDGVFVAHMLLLVLALICILAIAILWQSTGRNKLGRYLYPGLTSVATLLALGWAWWFGLFRRTWFAPVINRAGILIFIGVMVYSAGWSTYDTFRNLLPHPLIRPLPADVTHTQLVYLDPADNQTPVAAVTGYRLSYADFRPGNALFMDVCWRSYGYTAQNFPYTVQIVGPDDTRYGTRNSYHGLGSYPLVNWSAEDEFCDPTSVYIASAADRPRAYNLYVSLFQADLDELKAGPALRTLDGEGRETYPVIDRVRVAPLTMPVVTPTVNVGNLAGLVDSHMELRDDNVLSVTLRFLALQSNGTSAKIFLHVLDGNGKVIAQNDHEPDGGWFPTAYWLAGDVIDDSFEVQLPEGVALQDVELRTGLYDSKTLERLPATRIVDGERLRDDLIPLSGE